MIFGYEDISEQYRIESRMQMLAPLPNGFYYMSAEYICRLGDEVRAHMLSGEDVSDYEDLKCRWKSA